VNFIEALESVNMTTFEGSPNLTVMDNQTARMGVGEETPIRVLDASTAAAGGQGTVVPTAQVTTRETGIILEVTPHVTEGGKILLQLRAERSAARLAESDAGFVFDQQYADSRVLANDGQTVVIAGLTVTETNEVRSGIPLLMDIPIIGRLFRVTRENTIQRDLMILVTPTIVPSEGN
jgi:type II secretory pathway component GspD/PulD (secretin)